MHENIKNVVVRRIEYYIKWNKDIMPQEKEKYYQKE